MPRERQPRVELFLVSSAGGHLQQLLLLRDAWGDRSRLWVTDDAADTRSLLRDEDAVFGDAPSSRSWRSLFTNSGRAGRLLYGGTGPRSFSRREPRSRCRSRGSAGCSEPTSCTSRA